MSRKIPSSQGKLSWDHSSELYFSLPCVTLGMVVGFNGAE